MGIVNDKASVRTIQSTEKQIGRNILVASDEAEGEATSSDRVDVLLTSSRAMLNVADSARASVTLALTSVNLSWY